MLRRELKASQEKIESRLDGVDKLHLLFEKIIDHFPENTAKQIALLKELVYETFKTLQVKFDAVQTEFSLRDDRVKETAIATKVAVDAALQAAEKAVQKQNEAFGAATAKAEDGFNKQIEAMGQLIQTETRGLGDKFNDTKERLTRMEAMGLGRDTSEKRGQESSTHVVSIIAACIGAVGLLVAIAAIVVTIAIKAH
jgi:hypothetical protein